MIFAGVDDAAVRVEFAKKNMMHMKFLERKTDLFDAALSSAFGRPMKVAFALEGTPRATGKAALPAKGLIEQSYDIFGRENIELTE